MFDGCSGSLGDVVSNRPYSEALPYNDDLDIGYPRVHQWSIPPVSAFFSDVPFHLWNFTILAESFLHGREQFKPDSRCQRLWPITGRRQGVTPGGSFSCDVLVQWIGRTLTTRTTVYSLPCLFARRHCGGSRVGPLLFFFPPLCSILLLRSRRKRRRLRKRGGRSDEKQN